MCLNTTTTEVFLIWTKLTVPPLMAIEIICSIYLYIKFPWRNVEFLQRVIAGSMLTGRRERSPVTVSNVHKSRIIGNLPDRISDILLQLLKSMMYW